MNKIIFNDLKKILSEFVSTTKNNNNIEIGPKGNAKFTQTYLNMVLKLKNSIEALHNQYKDVEYLNKIKNKIIPFLKNREITPSLKFVYGFNAEIEKIINSINIVEKKLDIIPKKNKLYNKNEIIILNVYYDSAFYFFKKQGTDKIKKIFNIDIYDNDQMRIDIQNITDYGIEGQELLIIFEYYKQEDEKDIKILFKFKTILLTFIEECNHMKILVNSDFSALNADRLEEPIFEKKKHKIKINFFTKTCYLSTILKEVIHCYKEKEKNVN